MYSLPRTKTKRSETSKAPPTIQKKTKVNNILTRMFTKLGKKRSTSRGLVQPVLDVVNRSVDDRFGDVPVLMFLFF